LIVGVASFAARLVGNVDISSEYMDDATGTLREGFIRSTILLPLPTIISLELPSLLPFLERGLSGADERPLVRLGEDDCLLDLSRRRDSLVLDEVVDDGDGGLGHG
jgi:hypothetical protein